MQDDVIQSLDSQPYSSHQFVSVRQTWDILGPFQVGTREAAWGADPLERHGGFTSLEPDTSNFKSSLAAGGVVTWSSQNSDCEINQNGLKVVLDVYFPSVDWTLLRSFYGWNAWQYQTWARTYITIHDRTCKSYEFYTDGILEFNVDGQRYFGGDFYKYRRAPLVLQLDPGTHKIELRLLRDIRSMGGLTGPAIRTQIKLCPCPQTILVDLSHLVAPDIVKGKLTSPFGSVPVRNNCHTDVEVIALETNKGYMQVSESYAQPLPIKLRRGQTRPLIFVISQDQDSKQELSFRIVYRLVSQPSELIYADVCHELTHRELLEPHKYTYLMPTMVVSYAMLSPPQILDKDNSHLPSTFPVLVYLHGAGVEADSDLNTTTLNGAEDLPMWIVYAGGCTTWSGDDWHQWGWADVEAGIEALKQYVVNRECDGIGVDVSKWLVAGHSNGGQGVWFALTHRSDKVFAAVPASGYSSVQKYVPYSFWHETDPRRMAVLHAALNSYRHELLISNIKGIPVAQQHSDDDQNVPCYHSRYLSQKLTEIGWGSTYNELINAGHFKTGMMTTPFLRRFYQKALEHRFGTYEENLDFVLTVANPADTGSKEGVKIERLVDPGQLGAITVQAKSNQLILDTSNVQVFSLYNRRLKNFCILVDEIEFTLDSSDPNAWSTFRLFENKWKLGRFDLSDNYLLSERSGNQLGNLDAILRTRGKFLIQNCHVSTSHLALQISRNLFQYFAADTEIFESDQTVPEGPGNLITIGVGNSIAPGFLLADHPFHLSESSIYIQHHKEYKAKDHGLSAIYLRPLGEERLELVIWGTDSYATENAARLMPLITGTGQPDFVISTGESRWRGIDGVLAMGFFNSSWEVSPSSFLL